MGHDKLPFVDERLLFLYNDVSNISYRALHSLPTNVIYH